MQQLTAMDSIFLSQETAQAPMHIGLMMFYVPPAKSRGPVRFKDILAVFEERAGTVPIFHHMLEEMPFDFDYPYWVDAPNLDIEFHVRHIALPAPGDWRQLCIQVARLHARRIDRSRPLWEAYVIGGLDNIDFLAKRSFAILFKLHHAAVDGISGFDAIRALHDPSPRRKKERARGRAYQPEAKPPKLELLGRSTINRLRSPARWFRAARELVPAAGRLRRGFREEQFHTGQKRQNTRFNDIISPHRVVEARFFDLDEVKAIRQAVEGATVNDVLVTVIAGAMRKYLESKDELPEVSPVSIIPLSFRNEFELHDGGNLVTAMTMAIHSEIEDPLQRLREVHEESVSSKALAEAVGTRTSLDLTQIIPPQLASFAMMRTGVRLMKASGVSAPVNTVITNVAGPREPLYLCGAKLVAAAGFGPLMDSVGLFHAILSCDGKISIAIAACRDMMPDPGFYAECIQASFEELRDATGVSA